jgi:hypothetical protein
VKTSAATGLTFTFAGLIRAHGQSGGGTTWNPETTFATTWATDVSTTWNQEATYVATTWPGHETSTTYDPNGSYVETTNPNQEYTTTYDPNVYETTQPATIQTTITTTQSTTVSTTSIVDLAIQGYHAGSPVVGATADYGESAPIALAGGLYMLKVKYWMSPDHGSGNLVVVEMAAEIYSSAGNPISHLATSPRAKLEGSIGMTRNSFSSVAMPVGLNVINLIGQDTFIEPSRINGDTLHKIEAWLEVTLTRDYVNHTAIIAGKAKGSYEKIRLNPVTSTPAILIPKTIIALDCEIGVAVIELVS